MKQMIHSSRGFTWIELFVTLLVLSFLGALAIPAYQDYKRRSYFNSIVQAVAPYRAAVGECIQHTKKVIGCNAGTNRIPPPVKTPAGPVSSLQVNDGIITVVPVPAHGITAAETYILTPSVDTNSGDVVWKSSGGGVAAGYTK